MLLSSASYFHLSLPRDLAQKPCLRTRVVFSNRWCAAQAALGRVLQHYLNEICLPYGKGRFDEERAAKHQELGEAGL